MIAKLFLALTDYPLFRRIMWKPIYEILAKKFQVKDWQFMNYGYVPFDYERPVKLEPKDEINRFPLQLYHYLAVKVNMDDCDVLEVGSGRGGGCSYIKRYTGARKVTGLDIAHNAVLFAKNAYKTKGLYFIQGNAEVLPFEDGYFDVVLNVESCHAYGSVPKFFAEVRRVLADGGHFLCTDLRSPDGMTTLRKYIDASGMQLVEEEVITENVVRAIEMEEPVKMSRIERDIPAWFQKMFKEFAGVKGSKIHSDLKSGTLVYYRFVLKKQANG